MIVALVPALNEEGRIAQVIKALSTHVDSVVVIDDGSVDATAVVAKEAGAHVLMHRINRGQGAALETGQLYARDIGADIVVHFDGDGQFDADDIDTAIAVLQEKNVDIVLGSRFLDDRTHIPFVKKYILFPPARIVNRIVTGLRITDIHNGFRILNKHALNTLYISQDRMAHASEILALIKKNKLTYAETPVKVTYHEFGQGIGGGIRILKDLFIGKLLK